ncbi:MAPEG family protein [Paracoccaceae bacterium GXU_MW_L88]
MSPKRRIVLAGMAGGAVWAVLVVWLGTGPVRRIVPEGPGAMFTGAFLPGLVYMAMIGRLAAVRFFSDTLIDGGKPAPGSGTEIDLRVLQNTSEQLLLAALIWPFADWQLGAGGALVLTLGAAFALTRLAFWIGYHRAPALRGFGFAGGFYPTILAALLALGAAFI